jgi:predicted transcriptional regulator
MWCMKTQNVQYFTDKEEEFVKLLIDVGTKQSIAKVLVFLANTPEATSRDIERGTDLRQPEVSIAMRYLTSQNWIKSRESKGESKGRPLKIYVLSRPINDIMNSIEKEKKEEAKKQLALVQKLRDYIR